MSNPKDWFRRRRRDQVPPGGEADDPFADGAILELGRSASVVPLGRPEPRLPQHGSPVVCGEPGRSAAKSVPPPAPRSAELRAPRVIESHAFAIRPEITRPSEPHRLTPLASHPGHPGEARAESAAQARSRAVPFARPVPVCPPSPHSPVRAAETSAAAPPPSRPPVGDGAALAAAPSFTLTAPGLPWLRRGQGADGASSAALREAFTPTRPKQRGSAFFGRYAQMQRIISAIEEERAHIVLYGERGSGKTSLANIIASKAEEAGYFVVKFACSSELSFEDLFRSFLRRIPSAFLAEGVGATSRAGIDNFEALLSPGEIGIAELVGVFGRLHDKHVILVIDEYDRVTNETTRNKLAELIKNMSDASVPVTILLIGVAEDVDALLGKHPSLQRTLVTVPLPLMTAREIDGIISGGEERSGLRFSPEVRQRIIELAQGLPYHAQLLCLFAARCALRRQSRTIEREDLRYAALRAAEEAESKVKEAYAQAVASTQGGTAFKDVLFAAARCACDPFGTFTVAEVARAAAEHGITLSTLALQYPLKKLTEPARGAMLRRINGLDGLRYQFTTQMMRHHVLVRQAVERGLV